MQLLHGNICINELREAIFAIKKIPETADKIFFLHFWIHY